MSQQRSTVLDLDIPDIAARSRVEAALPVSGAILAHISLRGDVQGRFGTWLGGIGSGLAIEGLMASAPTPDSRPDLTPALEYQCFYGSGLRTPWMRGGQPCGSAGLGLPCLGLRFRLDLESAPFFDCAYDVIFGDGTRQDGVPSPAIARAASGSFVEAVRLRLEVRGPVPTIVLSDLDHRPPPPGGRSPADDPWMRLRLLSPAFATRPPKIRNGGLIPAGARHAMDACWDRRIFAARTVSLRVVDQAFVLRDGLVFDSRLTAVPGTTRFLTEQTVAAAQSHVAATRERQAVRRIVGNSLLCVAAAPDDYGRYLTEMFPKAWLARRLLPDCDLRFIVRQTDILPLVEETLMRIGVRPEAIVVTDGEPLQCERLLILDGLSYHGHYQSPLCAQALAGLTEKLPIAPYPKLFIRHRDHYGRLINEPAVEQRLTETGFVGVDPGEMTLAEQIVLFKGAKTIVGGLGPAMMNVAFCAGVARVVALTAASFPDTFLWLLCQHRRHEYIEIRGRETASSGRTEEAGFTIGDADLAFLATL